MLPTSSARYVRIFMAFGATITLGVTTSLIASVLYAWWIPSETPTPGDEERPSDSAETSSSTNAGQAFPLGSVTFLMLIAAGGAYLAKQAITGYFRIESRPLARRNARQKKVLVWFLSNLRVKSTDCYEEHLPNDVPLSSPNLKTYLDEIAVFEKQHPSPRWSWAQPLRGVWHNIKPTGSQPGPLQLVVFVCSPESMDQVKHMGKLIEYFVDTAKLEVAVWLQHDQGALKNVSELGQQTWKANGWDFDAFDVMYESLLRLLSVLAAKGYSEHDIAIDLTAGLKPNSVAAAAVSIGRPVVNQYVCTNPRDRSAETWEYEVLEYDLMQFSQATES